MNNRYKFPVNFWDNNKNKIIDMYINQNITANKIGLEFGCYGSTIINHLKEWNINIRNSKENQYNNIYNLDIHIFDTIDSEEKAYLLGYILADGHVSKNGLLMFCCHSKDVDILEKIKKILNSNHPIKKRNNQDAFVLNMGSKYICEKLIEMGLVHDKTYNLNFEKLISYVPDELIHHFIRGMFDGDGSIKYYNYEYAKGYQYHFGYTGLKNVCEFVSIFLHMNTKLIMECENFYTCRTANANVILYIYEKLYNNATVYCDRKHNTFLEVILLINRENKNTVNGVNWNKQSNKWLAIYGCKDKNNKKINKRLGNFDNKEDAIKARLQYEYELHGNNARQWFFFEKYKIGEYSNE